MKKSIRLRNFADIKQLVACVSAFIVYISLIAYRIEPETSFLGYVGIMSTFLGSIAAMLGAAAAIQASLIWQRQLKAPVRYQLLLEASKICCELENAYASAKFKKVLWDKEKTHTEHYNSYPEKAVGKAYDEHQIKVKRNKDGRCKLEKLEPKIALLSERLLEISKQIDSVFDINDEDMVFGDYDVTQLEASAYQVEMDVNQSLSHLKSDESDESEENIYLNSDSEARASFSNYLRQLKVLENSL
ncbi:MAG: hypothetical protein ACI88H_004209 [Cocleimonas sp.]